MQHLSTPLVIWLILFGLHFLLIQYCAWMWKWRPARLAVIQAWSSKLLGRPLSPVMLLAVTTGLFWIATLVLLRLHCPASWRISSHAVMWIPILLAVPCYFVGKSQARTVRRLGLLTDNERNRWSYGVGGTFIAIGAVAIPVLIYLGTGNEEMLSALCPTMGFVGGVVLTSFAGYIAEIERGIRGVRAHDSK